MVAQMMMYFCNSFTSMICFRALTRPGVKAGPNYYAIFSSFCQAFFLMDVILLRHMSAKSWIWPGPNRGILVLGMARKIADVTALKHDTRLADTASPDGFYFFLAFFPLLFAVLGLPVVCFTFASLPQRER